MSESRRRFVRIVALGTTALIAGCMNARESGDESSPPATTTGGTQPTSETAANTPAATETETTEGTTTSPGDGSTAPDETITMDGRTTTDVETTESDTAVTETTEATVPPGSQTTVGDARYVGKFTLWNDDNDPHTVVVSVAKGNSELLNETYEIEADSATSIANPITKQGTYRIRVETQSGAENTFEWKIQSCNNYEYIQIYINETSEIKFRKLKQTYLGTPTCSNQTTDSGEQENQ